MAKPVKRAQKIDPKSSHVAVPLIRDFALLRPSVQIGVLLALGVAIYLNILHAPFLYDDQVCIVSNPAIRHLKYFFDFDLVRSLHIPLDFQNSFVLRPVVYFTFALNYFVGGSNPFGFHLANLLIHLGNTVLVYLLVGTTLKLLPLSEISPASPSWEKILPFLVALLFVAHPLQTQAVTYTTQRFTSLVAFFSLSSLLLYIKAQVAEKMILRRSCYGVALLLTLLAMKSKETAFTLPVIILLFDLFFLTGTRQERIYRLTPFLLTMAIIPATLIGLTPTASSGLTEGTLSESINLVNFNGVRSWDYLQTQFGVIVVYLRLLILPFGQNFDHDYRLAQGFFTWRVGGALLLLLMLFAAALFSAVRSFRDSRRHEERLIAFGILWFFVTLSVESSIIPIDDLLLEYRLYLPSFGFFLTLATASLLAVKRGILPWRGVIITATVVVILLATATVVRNDLYRDNIRLLEDVVRKSPEKPRAHALLGAAYLLRNRLDQAETEFRQVLRFWPKDAKTIANLGTVYLARGDNLTAMGEYQRSLEIDPDNPDAHANLAICHVNLGKMIEAERELKLALDLSPNFRDGRRNLASIYENQGRIAEAIVQYRKLLEYFPQDADALARLQILSAAGMD